MQKVTNNNGVPFILFLLFYFCFLHIRKVKIRKFYIYFHTTTCYLFTLLFFFFLESSQTEVIF